MAEQTPLTTSSIILLLWLMCTVVLSQTQYAPRITIPQNTYDANSQGTLTIPCNIDANPDVTEVTWKRITNGVTTNVSIPSGGKYGGGNPSTPALTIFNIFSGDAGQYLCEARNSIAPSQSNIVNVDIYYAPVNIRVSPQSVRVYSGESVFVSCFADAVPAPTFTWTKVPNTAVISTSQNLSIPSAKRSDNGLYKCEAANKVASVNVVMQISVWYAPVLRTSPSPQVVNVGSNLTLPCNIDANPTVYTVEWQKGGSDLNMSNPRISGGTSSATPHLTFTDIQKSDSGSYSCVVNNVVNSTISVVVQVNVIFPPQNVVLTPSGSVINLNENGALNLTCSADGEPTLTYKWKAGSSIIGSGSVLFITSATPDDNRDVTCEVTNGDGIDSKTIAINVSYRPRGSDEDELVFTTNINTAVTLRCENDANPTATSYEWIFKGETLAETGLSLQVTPASESDFGDYTCKATNAMGTSEPIIIRLRKERDSDPPATAGVSTPIIIVIVLIIIIFVVIVAVIVVICYKKGWLKKCLRKKDDKRRVGPTDTVENKQSPKKPGQPAGVRSPQWSAVSRQHVDITVGDNQPKEPDKLRFDDETTVYGQGRNGNINSGDPIPYPSGKSPRLQPIQLLEKKKKTGKKRKKKKRHQEEVSDRNQGEITDGDQEDTTHPDKGETTNSNQEETTNHKIEGSTT